MTDHRSRLDRALARKAHHAEQLALAEADLARSARAEEDALEAQRRLQGVAEGVQSQAHSGLAGVATGCLKSVFGGDCYELRIHFEQKRGRTEARLALHDSRGRDIGDPLDSTGHGYIDVASWAMRVAAMVLKRDRVRRLFVADEPFRAVSRNHRPRVRRAVEELAVELGVQVVLVTHDPELVCGDVIDLGEE